jgi:myo-inositol-1(or 4)-monophosphatase
MSRSPLLTVMVNAVLKAGRALKRDFGEVENLQVSVKGPSDFVTNADRKAERILLEELSKARPDYGFLTEESGVIAGRDAEHRFIIDPLDGTTNFLHSIPHFAISVAAENRGVLTAAVIYNPITEEVYEAEKGKGVFLNNRRLRVSGRRQFEEAVLACGVPHRGRGDHPVFMKQMSALMPAVAGIRRMGAASLDLAYVAAGRYDGFWEEHLGAWDIAAGALMVREAGGTVTDMKGGQNFLETGAVIAGNQVLHPTLSKKLSDIS